MKKSIIRQITDEELERIVEDLLKKETTREKVSKDYKCDIKTVNDQITKLASINPELYQRFVMKFPYLPKSCEHIKPKSLLIDMVFNDLTKQNAAQKYNVSSRYITKVIKQAKIELASTEPLLISLYEQLAIAHKKRIALELALTPAQTVQYDKLKKFIQDEERQKRIQKRLEHIKRVDLQGNPSMKKRGINTLKRIESETKVIGEER